MSEDSTRKPVDLVGHKLEPKPAPPAQGGGMPAWAKDKKTVGIMAAAAVGLVVLLRGGGGGGGLGGEKTDPEAEIAAYNSTSADIANQLGQYGNSITNSLSEYDQRQRDAIAKWEETLNSKLDGITNRVPGSPTAPAKPGAIPVKWRQPVGGLLQPGYGWFATSNKRTWTTAQVARKAGISEWALLQINPGMKRGVIRQNTPVRIRNNAAPWNLAAYRRVNRG